MCAAVYFHLASTGLQGFPLGHVENYSYNFEEPALYLLIFALLWDIVEPELKDKGSTFRDHCVPNCLKGWPYPALAVVLF